MNNQNASASGLGNTNQTACGFSNQAGFNHCCCCCCNCPYRNYRPYYPQYPYYPTYPYWGQFTCSSNTQLMQGGTTNTAQGSI